MPRPIRILISIIVGIIVLSLLTIAISAVFGVNLLNVLANKEPVGTTPPAQVEEKPTPRACPSVSLKHLKGWGWMSINSFAVWKRAMHVPKSEKRVFVDRKGRSYQGWCKPSWAKVRVRHDARGYYAVFPEDRRIPWDRNYDLPPRYAELSGWDRYSRIK